MSEAALPAGARLDIGEWPDGAWLDCRGMRCPRPVIELARTVARDAAVDVSRDVLLVADDPATEVDVPAWCRMRGATVLDSGRTGSLRWFRVRPASALS